MKKKCYKELLIFKLANDKIVFFCPMYLFGSRSTLWENLELLNERLPFVVEKLFDYVCECKNSRMLLTEAVQRLVCENPCQLTRPEVKYPYMIKELLHAFYCGMGDRELWDGRYKVKYDLLGVGNSLTPDELKEALYEQCIIKAK